MRKTIIFLGVVSMAAHLGLIAFGKTEFSDPRMFVLGILFVAWGTLPFVILATVGKYVGMPKLVLVLGIFSLAASCLLFWDVYVSAKSSTAAIGLAIGPVVLSIVLLFVLGTCAVVRSFWFRKYR